MQRTPTVLDLSVSSTFSLVGEENRLLLIIFIFNCTKHSFRGDSQVVSKTLIRIARDVDEFCITIVLVFVCLLVD
jgi:hypothetical protein